MPGHWQGVVIGRGQAVINTGCAGCAGGCATSDQTIIVPVSEELIPGDAVNLWVAPRDRWRLGWHSLGLPFAGVLGGVGIGVSAGMSDAGTALLAVAGYLIGVTVCHVIKEPGRPSARVIESR